MNKLANGIDEKADLRKCALSGDTYYGDVDKRVIDIL